MGRQQRDLEALATQIEQATEDQQQDMLAAAFDALHPAPPSGHNDKAWSTLYYGVLDMLDAKAYESAAMMLCHPNAMWAAGDMEDSPFARLCWPQAGGSFINGYHEGHASTAALALAAACCRAVAQMGEG